MNGELIAFGQVVLVDLVLAGDNAVVIGALAASLPVEQRKKAVAIGTVFAIAARIVLSLCVVWLLMIPFVMPIGGILLLGVAWKMWQDLRSVAHDGELKQKPAGALHKAIFAIVLADISMSLDNVLAVGGAAQGHLMAMAFGLVLSIALMGVAAGFIANVMNRHRWIAYVGLALIVFVAGRMIWHGVADFL